MPRGMILCLEDVRVRDKMGVESMLNLSSNKCLEMLKHLHMDYVGVQITSEPYRVYESNRPGTLLMPTGGG